MVDLVLLISAIFWCCFLGGLAYLPLCCFLRPDSAVRSLAGVGGVGFGVFGVLDGFSAVEV